MDLQTYQEIYKLWIDRKPDERVWTNDLAIKYGYPSSEAVRSSFRRGRKMYEENRGEVVSYKVNTGNARICVFDLEFSPLAGYTFQLFDTNIGVDQIISHPFMISWSAKMLNESEIYSDVLTSEEAVNKDDLRIVKSLWEFLNTCQIFIGHNIRDYDLKKLNIQLLKHKISPLNKYQIIDTLQIARKSFSFPSNSLKYINSFLGIKEKKQNEGFLLWKKCMDGDANALKNMDSYCQGDVVATEDTYYRLLPFIQNHPNLGLFFNSEETHCPNCGNVQLVREGFYYTPSGKYQTVRCNNCGAVGREKQNLLDKNKRKSLIVG